MTLPRDKSTSFAARSALKTWVLAAAMLASGAAVFAQEAVIRKNLAERMGDLGRVDEVSKSPIPGLYEVRMGTDIYYSDEQGNYLIEGAMVDTKARVNLTEARQGRLVSAELASRAKDTIVWKQGNGSRKLVVFADPNCGYCKRLETDLQKVKDITVHTFPVAILGADSQDKVRNIWCAKNNTKAWRDWMLNNTAPAKAIGQCDETALARNLQLMRSLNLNGTPAIFFEDGTKVPGALSADQIEQRLAAKPKDGGK